MANTYTALHVHFIWSTKDREPLIDAQVAPRLWAYIGGIAKQNKLKPLSIGGHQNHVHALIGTTPTSSISEVAKRLKGVSSHWVSETFPALRGFTWQDGYGAFTVSKSNLPEVIAYIEKRYLWG